MVQTGMMGLLLQKYESFFLEQVLKVCATASIPCNVKSQNQIHDVDYRNHVAVFKIHGVVFRIRDAD